MGIVQISARAATSGLDALKLPAKVAAIPAQQAVATSANTVTPAAQVAKGSLNNATNRSAGIGGETQPIAAAGDTVQVGNSTAGSAQYNSGPTE